jgi:hypothetical protein
MKLEMKRNLLTLGALLLLMSPIAAGAAPIIYDVDRTIGAGTVTGFVQTDGTLGVLNTVNITDWTLNLTAPNLLGGSPDVIDFATGGLTFLSGSATTATLTQLLFDFSTADSIFLLQGGSNYWCLETANLNCTGLGAGEHIGQGIQTNVAQTVIHSGSIVVGTVAAVPEPEIYAMMGVGLGLLGWVGRRKKLREGAAA